MKITHRLYRHLQMTQEQTVHQLVKLSTIVTKHSEPSFPCNTATSPLRIPLQGLRQVDRRLKVVLTFRESEKKWSV